MRADLLARARKVAAVAEAGLRAAGSDAYILADTTVGTHRAGATVIGVPMRIEKSHRVLGNAIRAAG